MATADSGARWRRQSATVLGGVVTGQPFRRMTWVAGSAATCWRRRWSKWVVAPYPEPTVIHAGPAPRNGQAVQGGRTGVAQRERRVARMQENDGHALQRRTAFGGSLVPRARSAEDSASQT